MERNTEEEIIEVVTHFKNVGGVECFCFSEPAEGWFDVSCPNWNFQLNKYRKKKKYLYRYRYEMVDQNNKKRIRDTTGYYKDDDDFLNTHLRHSPPDFFEKIEESRIEKW